MASTLYTTKTSTTTIVPPRACVGETSLWETYALAAALVVNDIIQMVKVQTGFTVLEVVLASADVDTHSTPTIVMTVGDDGDTDRYITTSVGTIGQGGGVCRLNNQVGHCYTYTADNTIDIKVTTAPATGATSGTISLSVIGTMEQ